MMKRIATYMFGCVVLGAILSTAGCAQPRDHDALAAVKAAVHEPPAGIDEILVDDGVDGLSRYVFVEVRSGTDAVSDDDLAAILRSIGDALPEEFDSVRLIARAASGERLDLTKSVQNIGVGGVFMINALNADIRADALRDFAGAH
jgi:hypothetical protein